MGKHSTISCRAHAEAVNTVVENSTQNINLQRDSYSAHKQSERWPVYSKLSQKSLMHQGFFFFFASRAIITVERSTETLSPAYWGNLRLFVTLLGEDHTPCHIPAHIASSTFTVLNYARYLPFCISCIIYWNTLCMHNIYQKAYHTLLPKQKKKTTGTIIHFVFWEKSFA